MAAGTGTQLRRLMPVLALVVLGVTAVHHRRQGNGDDSTMGSACDDSVGALVSSCKEYVMGVLPPLPSNPGACCDAAQAAPLDCVCSRVPSYLADIVNQQAVKNVMRTCGVQIPAGTTCGGVVWGN